MTGATQGSSQKTDKKEITGAERRENGPCWCDVQSQAKKVIFLNGEVFFFLTYPLMGDPLIIDLNVESKL